MKRRQSVVAENFCISEKVEEKRSEVVESETQKKDQAVLDLPIKNHKRGPHYQEILDYI